MCKFTLHKFYMNLGDTSLYGSILQMFWNASILWTGCSCCVYTHVSAGAENNVFPSHLLFCFFLHTVWGPCQAFEYALQHILSFPLPPLHSCGLPFILSSHDSNAKQIRRFEADTTATSSLFRVNCMSFKGAILALP